MRVLLIFVFFQVLASPVIADIPQLTQGSVSITVVYPDGKNETTVLSNAETGKLLAKHIQNGTLSVAGYKVDFWVYGAFLRLGIPFKQKSEDGKVIITQIRNISNSSEGRWVYYVNGLKSPYSINTQTDDKLKTIKFVFEKQNF